MGLAAEQSIDHGTIVKLQELQGAVFSLEPFAGK